MSYVDYPIYIRYVCTCNDKICVCQPSIAGFDYAVPYETTTDGGCRE